MRVCVFGDLMKAEKSECFWHWGLIWREADLMEYQSGIFLLLTQGTRIDQDIDALRNQVEIKYLYSLSPQESAQRK